MSKTSELGKSWLLVRPFFLARLASFVLKFGSKQGTVK